MSREKQGYRILLEEINGIFPDIMLLNITQVSKVTGISKPLCSKRYPFKEGYIAKTELARVMLK